MLPHLTLWALTTVGINIRVQMITGLEGNTGQQAWKAKLTARGKFCFSSDFTTACHLKPIPAAARFKMYVCSGSIAGIGGSNPVEGMALSFRFYCVFSRQRPLRTADHSFRRYLLWACADDCLSECGSFQYLKNTLFLNMGLHAGIHADKFR